jgi:hypothetical protein
VDSPGIPVSSTNKTDRHNITEILLKVALNNHTPKTINNNRVIPGFIRKQKNFSEVGVKCHYLKDFLSSLCGF